MDVTTLIAGPAQAGSKPPVGKPGAGCTAGAGHAPATGAATADGFASLVAAALDPQGGVSTSHRGAIGEGAVDDAGAVAGRDAASPTDAAADAATLSLLIALTTGVTPLGMTPPPAVTAPGPAAAAGPGGDVAGVAVTPAVDATDSPLPSTLPAVTAATPTFEDALASAAVPAGAPAAATAATAVVSAASAASPAAAPVAATPAPAAPAEPPDAPAAPVRSADASAPSTGSTAAATSPASAPRAGRQPAAHPLRQALAAIAAAAPADTASAAAAQPGEPTAMPRTPVPVASAPAAGGSAIGHENRAAGPRDGAAAANRVPVLTAASDSGAASDGSSSGAPGGFAGGTSWAPFRGVESRVERSAASLASPTGSVEIANGAPLPATAGFGAGVAAGFGVAGDTLLRAVDMPAAARFEQTLSSVDPDVRNLEAMVRTVRLFTAGSGAHEARLTLEPEHLGHVGLTVRVEQGSVSAHFRAETPAAQRWIETHQQELRAGLREQGLDVKDLVVTTDPDGRRERRQDAQPARAPRARRPQGADAPRFEVLV